jgi:hypothetical protein
MRYAITATAFAALLLSLTTIVVAQNHTSAFEVATIKPTDPAFQGNLITFPAGTVSARGMTLRELIGYVYDLDNQRVLAVPKILESER